MLTRLLAFAAVAVLLAGCGSAGPSGAPDAGQDADFTAVTVEHAFGTTEITQRPQRIVAWGWGAADAAIALGAPPVAMPRMTYGADADGYLPWVREALEVDGEPLPDLLDDNGSPPFEQIAAAMPDVILANYSGITQADYDKLDQIAPTIAYPDAPWTTPWRDVVTTVGDVLGESDRARVLLDDLDATLADTAAAHPQFAGKSIAAVSAEPAAFYVYNGRDPRVQYLEDLGFEVAPSVAALDTRETDFYYTLSTERLDELTSDVLLSYSDTPGDVQRIAESPEIQAMDQYRRGAVAPVAGTSLISSVSPPTALSLTWGLDDYVAALQEAVAAPG